jgi:ppGpp synthetase/RelA/SpoT-type nucleotidyltranferase
MNANDAARDRYVRESEWFRSASRAMEQSLDDLLRSMGVRAHVEVREKTVGSFVKKIHLRKYTDPWAEVTDKLGGRVIVKTLDDLHRVCEVLLSEPPPFTVLWHEDKREEAKVDELYYPGVHVQVLVPGVTTSDGEPIECEIQVRTKAQDLWSVPSHELVYKGVIEPSRQTKRRILRLSVLTEMFDEEVRLAMREVATDPRYELALLLRSAESSYLTFVAEPGDDELSLEVLSIVVASVPAELRGTYADVLRQFVETQRVKLVDLFSTYGVYSDFASQYAYWLFSQPESLVVLERIEAAPQALAEAVSGSEIEDVVRHLFAAWGAPMPQVV